MSIPNYTDTLDRVYRSRSITELKIIIENAVKNSGLSGYQRPHDTWLSLARRLDQSIEDEEARIKGLPNLDLCKKWTIRINMYYILHAAQIHSGTITAESGR